MSAEDQRRIFVTKGDQAQWRLIVEFMESVPAEYVATHAELAAVADCEQRAVSHIITSRANPQLHSSGRRLVAVPGIGYRWARPAEIRDEVTRRRQLSVTRQFRKIVQGASAWKRHEDATDDDRKHAEEVAQSARELARVHRKASAELRGYRPERPVYRSSEI